MSREEKQHPRAREYVADLAARGRYHFVSAEAQAALGVSPAAAKLAISRLNKQRIVVSPARGFYVIVPPEYQSLRCLPADQFTIGGNFSAIPGSFRIPKSSTISKGTVAKTS